MTDWTLTTNARGDLVIIFGDGERRSLGPRDEAIVRFADEIGDEHVNERRFVVPEDGGTAG